MAATYERIRKDCDERLSVKIPDSICRDISQLNETEYLAFFRMMIGICKRDAMEYFLATHELDSVTKEKLYYLCERFFSCYSQANSTPA